MYPGYQLCTLFYLKSSQFCHYQVYLLTKLHVSIFYTVILRSIIKQYAGIAECHALTVCSDAIRCYAIQRAARRPVCCMYSSVEV